MAFIVEDGSVVAGANSYVSVDEADAYHENRLYSEDWNSASDDNKEKALAMATFWLDAKVRWHGTRKSKTSSLAWPRKEVYTPENLLLSDATIPFFLKWATSELARMLLVENRTDESSMLGIQYMQIESIQIRPSSDARDGKGKALFPRSVLDLIEPYGRISGGGGTATILRS